MTITRAHATNAVAAALAAEDCCPPDFFLTEGVHVVELTPAVVHNTLRRRFPLRDHSLSITRMGDSVVVAATSHWMPWVTTLFETLSVDEAVSPQLLSEVSRQALRDSYPLHGPYHYSVTTSADWRHRETPAGYAIQLVAAERLNSLDPDDWPNAISSRASDQGRHVTVAALALQAGVVVGVATATEDSDTLHQIAIDVQQEHQGRGLGRALTSQVAREVLEMGRVPYYGAHADNLPSLRTAQSAGFYPCWTTAFTTGESVH